MNATQLQLLSVKYQDKEKLRQLRVELQDKYTNIQNSKTALLQVRTDIWAGEQPDKPWSTFLISGPWKVMSEATLTILDSGTEILSMYSIKDSHRLLLEALQMSRRQSRGQQL